MIATLEALFSRLGKAFSSGFIKQVHVGISLPGVHHIEDQRHAVALLHHLHSVGHIVIEQCQLDAVNGFACDLKPASLRP